MGSVVSFCNHQVSGMGSAAFLLPSLNSRLSLGNPLLWGSFKNSSFHPGGRSEARSACLLSRYELAHSERRGWEMRAGLARACKPSAVPVPWERAFLRLGFSHQQRPGEFLTSAGCFSLEHGRERIRREVVCLGIHEGQPRDPALSCSVRCGGTSSCCSRLC